jgi:hypothetical protein
MTNQAHPFRFSAAVRPDEYSTPGAHHIIFWRDAFYRFLVFSDSILDQKLAFLNKVHPMGHLLKTSIANKSRTHSCHDKY